MNDCCFKDDDETEGCYHHQDDLENYQPPILFDEIDVKETRNQQREIRHYLYGCHHCLHSTAWWPTSEAALAHWNRINPHQMRIQEYRDLPPEAKR